MANIIGNWIFLPFSSQELKDFQFQLKRKERLTGDQILWANTNNKREPLLILLQLPIQDQISSSHAGGL